MNKTLSVSAIQNGTVIDHISSGQALRIIRLLRLLDKKLKVTVGMNLPSKRLQLKDIIKVENHVITHEEANDITIFAPQATINRIQNFEVTEKIKTTLPHKIGVIFTCPNPTCVTLTESIDSLFTVEAQGKQVKLTCQYCEKTFDRNAVKGKI